MNRLLFLLYLIFNIFIGDALFAQELYEIWGTVTDENNQPLQGATVFISGSQKITATGVTGHFAFAELQPGNYLISTRMLGYNSPSIDVTLRNKSLRLLIKLQAKSMILDEVYIRGDKNRERYMSIFSDQFLGKSADMEECFIVNPEIISLTGKEPDLHNLTLKAEADDLIVIENRILGYRIKYLLRAFEYSSKNSITSYDGETTFEEIEGTKEQKRTWEENRLKAYEGSLMHFLRSVYSNTLLEEGFIANQMVKSSNIFDRRAYMIPTPVKLSKFVARLDSSFVSYKFNALNIIYKPKKAARLQKQLPEQVEIDLKILKDKMPNDIGFPPVDPEGKSSQLLLYLNEALIDQRGSVYTGYKTFLIRGYWSKKRLADQLPFEYRPSEVRIQ
ncbi:carboxypeptidase-like regulatory domain-containing protein [Pedobacter endophyticus]|uniref:Carboxypeptidase-like regulatory domain-containing protein n=1 Tax=Pedobacter endophyticus TaxID=2789740 RepID=A0A7S9KY32_9SPHI|nr:carboxypeptidase-like regulatory domain-containing protein [Pedobacter endophyticus]QPH38937.1 carboxypeptidase-like regulatory domain-containing protein [Pedobacter endophyticus]